MDELQCVNCGAYPSDLIDPNCCMLCGRTLCDGCYDESSTCRECSHSDTEPQSGTCLECARNSMQLTEKGYCQGCVEQAKIEARQRFETL